MDKYCLVLFIARIYSNPSPFFSNIWYQCYAQRDNKIVKKGLYIEGKVVPIYGGEW
jgi:hypothetical protein